MGNISAPSGNPPAKQEVQIQQPYIFGLLPYPYPIETINPELMVYSNTDQRQAVTVDCTYKATDAVRFLKSKGCLQCTRLVIIVHGFRCNKDLDWLKQIKCAIFEQDNHRFKQDVAILGWGGGADIGIFRYAQAAANCLRTGKWLGEFLAALREDPDLKSLQTYAIGHSLGAHLVGVAGRSAVGALNRITGLDPAGIGFQLQNVNKRLRPTDAELVDVIHTDGLAPPYFGTLVPLGSVDFYPNFGWNQPTVDRILNKKPFFDEVNGVKKAKPSPYGSNISEGHGRAIAYFIWSIYNQGSFRTTLQLERKPGAEKAVHRIIGMPAAEVEMGYWCDRRKPSKCSSQNVVLHEHPQTDKPPTSPADLTQAHYVVDMNHTVYNQPKGCFYIHTNGSEPWC